MASTNLAFKEYEKLENDYETDKNSEHLLSNHIFVDLLDNGGNVVFRTFEDSINWASEELDTWRYIAVSTSPSQRLSFLSDIIAQQLSPAENILETSNSAIRGEITVSEATTAIRRYLDAYGAFCCVHSKSTLGQMALTMERYRPMVLGMLAGATGCVRPEAGRGFNKTADIEAFTFGYAIALQFRSSSRPETLSNKIADLENRISSFNKKQEHTDSNLLKLSDEISFLQKQVSNLQVGIKNITTNDEHLEKLEQSIQNITHSVDDLKLQYEEKTDNFDDTPHNNPNAIDYWLEMANMHTRKANHSLAWFVVTGFFAITMIIMTIVGLQETGFILRGYFDFVTFAVLAMPIFVSILLLSMLAFARIKNDNLADKAREKIALLETLSDFEFEGENDIKRKNKILEDIFEKN